MVKAMLVCAEECEGQHYAASTFLACNKNHEDVIATLAALGTTWLTHFLFVCQFYGLAMIELLNWPPRGNGITYGEGG